MEKAFCSHCRQKVFGDIVVKVNGEYYCQDCFNELFTECAGCGEIIRIEDSEEAFGDNYCRNCFDRRFRYCDYCDELFDIDDLQEVNGYYCCEHCFDQNFSYCDSCGGIFEHEDIFYHEATGQYVCEACYSDLDEPVHEYSYKPEPVFNKEKWENTVYLGVELEVEGSRYKANDFIGFVERIAGEDRLYLKHDGSIGEGFEIVTHPHTLKAYKKLYWKRVLGWLEKEGFTSYDNNRCGLHVHLNADYFSRKELLSLVWFFHKCWGLIHIFSKRKAEQLTQWARCWYEEEIKEYERYGYIPDTRYIAVNLENRHTVEIRVFRGTLNYKRFLATLQFVNALAGFVKEYSYSFFRLNNVKRIWKEFLRYSKEYKQLHSYLKQEALLI